MPASKAIGTETVSSGKWGMLCVSPNNSLVIVSPRNIWDYPQRQASGYTVYDRPNEISVELKRRTIAEFNRKRKSGERYANDYYAKCDDAPQTFSEFTDTWYGSLIRENLTESTLAEFQKVLSRRIADRRGIDKLRELADSLSADAAIPLVAHIDALIDGRFRSEFRFTYSRLPWPPQVSAASSLFSAVRQALDSRD